MSPAISIMTTPSKKLEFNDHHAGGKSPNTISSSSSSLYSTSPSPLDSSEESKTESRAAQKRKAVHYRRPSLLSSALQKQEVTTIDITDDPDGPPRLISYLNSSQGFQWNDEVFLPSYIDHHFVPLVERKDPVHEIRLSDEETKQILPQ